MFDLAVDLSQSLFAAHGQNRMPEADEEDDPGDVAEPGSVKPAQRILIQRDHARVQRVGGQLDGSAQNRNRAPDDQNDHHHGGDGHDLQGLLAGFMHALGVLPPEVGHDDDRDAGREVVIGKIQRAVQVHAHVLDEARQILARGDGADGASQNVVEEQGGDRELGESSAHGLFDDAVNTAAHEHAAGLDVQRPHGVAEQHDRKDEPGRALADDILGVAAGVISGRGQVGQNDGGSAPERNEGQHHRSGDEDLYYRFCAFRSCGHASEEWRKPR